ncbi:hypothetical protein BDC45DRAFT_557910 [Circinella umbellata]|nr:hypothetical protein BDC45DRAFT_557910 [Circinella umbellata]
MQDNAVDWWDGLSQEIKINIDQLKLAFQNYFGSGQEAAVVALSDLPNMEQRLESMVSFGARLKLALSQIDPKMKEELKLYFFNTHAREDVAHEVSRYKPDTLNRAVSYAIYLERTDKTVQSQYGNRRGIITRAPFSTPAALQQPTPITTPSDNTIPIEVDSNIQKYKNHKYNQKHYSNFAKIEFCAEKSQIWKELRMGVKDLLLIMLIGSHSPNELIIPSLILMEKHAINLHDARCIDFPLQCYNSFHRFK